MSSKTPQKKKEKEITLNVRVYLSLRAIVSFLGKNNSATNAGLNQQPFPLPLNYGGRKCHHSYAESQHNPKQVVWDSIVGDDFNQVIQSSSSDVLLSASASKFSIFTSLRKCRQHLLSRVLYEQHLGFSCLSIIFRYTNCISDKQQQQGKQLKICLQKEQFLRLFFHKYLFS